jgi:hypothetical protein
MVVHDIRTTTFSFKNGINNSEDRNTNNSELVEKDAFSK